jgi:hypothetical protein
VLKYRPTYCRVLSNIPESIRTEVGKYILVFYFKALPVIPTT